jgi:CelD/BcsL family acetyltransferase involved in cellulose biosynthesis
MDESINMWANNIKFITTALELDELGKSWEMIAAINTIPMQRFSWIMACASNFTCDGELEVVVLGAQGRLFAIAPLVKKSFGKLSRLEIVGLRELYEPMDLIWGDQPSLEHLAGILARLRLPIIFDRIPADSPSIRAIQKAFDRKGVVLCQVKDGWPFIPLDESWKVPEQNLASGRRSDLRRAYKRAKNIGQIRIEILSPQPNELASLLDVAFAVEAASWKGRAGTAMTKDAARGKFFRQYAYYACREGILRMCFMHIGNKAAAMQMAVEHNDQFWLLKIGYDDQFANCSPGSLLICETIKYAAERGLRSYEFLGKVEPWTAMWTKDQHPCVSVRAYPLGMRGITALGVDFTLTLRRRLIGVGRWMRKPSNFKK